MKVSSTKALGFVALSVWCISSMLISAGEAQQLTNQQVNAAVNSEARSSAVVSQDNVNAEVSNSGVMRENHAGSPFSTTDFMSHFASAATSNVFSGSWGSVGAQESRPMASKSKVVGGMPHSRGISSGNSGKTSPTGAAQRKAAYPSPGQFPDSANGSGALSPPMDYPASIFNFKTGVQPWRQNFDSATHLIISYASAPAAHSAKKSRHSSTGNLLSGNALSDGLNNNGFSGNLNDDSLPSLSTGTDSGLNSDPLSAQDDSVSGSDQPR